jgi:predicted MFS family arabinose efflux permease
LNLPIVPAATNKTIAGVLVVLAIAQVIGWGTVGLLAICSREIAQDLHLGIATVFAGNSVFYIVMGLAAPALARFFAQMGARIVMIAGTAVIIPGLLLLSLSHGPVAYFLAWTILGLGGSASLSTAAYIALNEIAGARTKSTIAALMLVTGLSSSLFWPLTSAVSSGLGWRGTCLAWSGLMLFVCLPLYVFGLPSRQRTAARDVDRPSNIKPQTSAAPRSTFFLLSATISLNSFVTFGFASVMIEFLKTIGLPIGTAIAVGSALGVVQVGARAMDMVGGGRWDGVTSGLIASAAMVAAMFILMAGGSTDWSIGGFILLYGLASGALAVARATMPLVFYDKAEYAKAAAHIALPLNVMSALAPPLLVGLMTNFGTNALLAVAAACSGAAFALLLLLSRRRPLQSMDAVA